MDNIHKKLKTYRKANGWTQTQMANWLGISQSGYQQIETGNTDSMRISTLRKICIEFNLSANWLLGLSDDMELRK